MEHGKNRTAGPQHAALFVIVTPVLEARFRYTNIDPGGEFYPGKGTNLDTNLGGYIIRNLK